MGYTKKARRRLTVCEHVTATRGLNDDIEDATKSTPKTISRSSSSKDGWRILRFHRRVGYGKSCYKRVQNAVLNWDFESQHGRKPMGILSATDIDRLIDSSYTPTRRNLLATFTEICLPKPLRSVFNVNPVHVVYDVKDEKSIPKCLFTSMAYATLKGHLLTGEERVTVIWRKGVNDEVDVEIISFSRAAPSIAGKVIWPLIGRMQKQFFLSEMDRLANIGKG